MIVKAKWGRRRILDYNNDAEESKERKFEELEDNEKLEEATKEELLRHSHVITGVAHSHTSIF